MLVDLRPVGASAAVGVGCFRPFAGASPAPGRRDRGLHLLAIRGTGRRPLRRTRRHLRLCLSQFRGRVAGQAGESSWNWRSHGPAALGAARGADRGAGPAAGGRALTSPFSPPAPGSRTAGRRRPRGRHRLLRCSWCPGCRWCCRCCCLSWVPQKLRSIQVTQPSLGRHAAPAGGVRRAAFVPSPPTSVAKRATAGVEAPSPPHGPVGPRVGGA